MMKAATMAGMCHLSFRRSVLFRWETAHSRWREEEEEKKLIAKCHLEENQMWHLMEITMRK